MNSAELSKIGVEIWGNRGWQTRMSEHLGVDGSTVRRWVSGAVPIPNPTAAALRCLHREREKPKIRRGLASRRR